MRVQQNGSFLLLIAAILSHHHLFLAKVHAWFPTHRLPISRASLNIKVTEARTTTVHYESKNDSSDNNGIPDIAGKDIYQRVFYRLSPASQVDVHNALVVEERVMFRPDPTKGEGYLRPVGHRRLILRDGQVDDGEIGDELFEFDVKEAMHDEATHAGAGRDMALEATMALILYLAANPKYIEGNVLELGCGLGLGTLLGSIGAGALKVNSSSADTDSDASSSSSSSEDILTIPKGTRLTDQLKLLTLTDEDPHSLELAVANSQHAQVPTNKVLVEEFDWRHRALSRSAPKLYHTIVAGDLNYNFPEAKNLAHNVATRLEALSSWQLVRGESKSPPTFIHVCPDAREDTSYLHRLLTKGYRMNVSSGYLKLEKLLFVYQMLPEGEPESKLDDLELEVQEFKETVYQSLAAEHHPDYAEGAGEIFFPIKTGAMEEASSSTYMEPESDGYKY